MLTEAESKVIPTAIQARQRLLRHGLELLLEPIPDIDIVGSVELGHELFELCSTRRPLVVMLEMRAQHWDPVRLAHRLQRRWRTLRFVGICEDDDTDVELARKSGIAGLVSLQTDTAAMVEVLRSAAFGPAPPIRVPASDPLSVRSLTDREIEILNLIAAGLTAKEVADRMGITYKTVENHKQRIFGKLGVQNQAHAVAVAFRRGLLVSVKVLALTQVR